MISTIFLTLLAAAPPQDPAPEAPAFTPATIAEGGAEVRAFHHVTMTEVAKLPAGTPVKIVAKRQPWARVQVPGGLVVWVFGKYVDHEGGAGTINSAHVRARPLPSTAPESYPVGQFGKGDPVQVLGSDGDWIQVRAPEALGGWVPLSKLVEYSDLPGDWDQSWKAARGLRLKGAAGPPVAEAAEKVDPGAGAEAPEVAPEPVKAAEASAAPPAAAPTPTAEALGKAEADLARLASSWSATTADQVEAVFGAVLWSSDDVVAVDRARNGLARLEVVRKAADLEAKVEAEKRRHAREAVAAEAAPARGAAAAAAPAPKAPAERFTLVGWLEYQPRVYSAVPYVVVAGAKKQPVLAKLGRYDMKEFVGREVAVEGTFRPSTVQGLKVLEVDRMRVLPKRAKKK